MSTNWAPISGDRAVRFRWSLINTGWPTREVLAHRAGGVGEHDDACAGRAGRPHRVHDVRQVMAFVGVHTTGQHQHAVLTDAHRQHLTGVARPRTVG